MRKLQIIIATTRTGRIGLPLAQWINVVAVRHGAFDDVEVVDLAEGNLPEPGVLRLDHADDSSAKIGQADAFVIVMPEYDHGFTAPPKNAIDNLHQEQPYKPAGLVSGGVAADARAAQTIKQVLTALKMVPVTEAAHIPSVAQFLDENEAIRPNELIDAAAVAMLDELSRWTDALASLREQARATQHAA
jgi:NAD(P)H-dependent FMN reductase